MLDGDGDTAVLFVVRPLGHERLHAIKLPSGRPTPVFDFLATFGIPFDAQLELVSWVRVCLALILLFSRAHLALLLALLWVLYLSIINLRAVSTFPYG